MKARNESDSRAMPRAEQLAAVALRGRTQSKIRAAGGKVGHVHPVELPDYRSRSESEAAERANATRFAAPWWRRQIYWQTLPPNTSGPLADVKHIVL